MRIVWSPTASQDLNEIMDYLTEHAGYAAVQRQADLIEASLDILTTFPYSGRTGRIERTYELVCVGTPYIAAYIVNDEVVRIVRLFHGKRMIP